MVCWCCSGWLVGSTQVVVSVRGSCVCSSEAAVIWQADRAVSQLVYVYVCVTQWMSMHAQEAPVVRHPQRHGSTAASRAGLYTGLQQARSQASIDIG